MAIKRQVDQSLQEVHSALRHSSRGEEACWRWTAYNTGIIAQAGRRCRDVVCFKDGAIKCKTWCSDDGQLAWFVMRADATGARVHRVITLARLSYVTSWKAVLVAFDSTSVFHNDPGLIDRMDTVQLIELEHSALQER